LIVRIKWTPVFKRKKLAWPRSKLILGALLLAPALPVSTEADVPLLTVLRRPAVTVVREESLAGFMQQKGFVKPYHLPEIMQAAAQASIPPSMIVCIEFVESSGGKYYDADTNNPLGWRNGRASFPSILDAIRHVSAELGSGRYYSGKTLEEKLRVYNPRPAYSIKVLGCMNQFAD
jgi:hypothetical protein